VENKKEKNTSISKKRGRGRPPGRKVLGTKQKFYPEHPNQDALIIKKPKLKADSEEMMIVPEDEASKHKYPPPKLNPVFRMKWMRFIDNVSSRENFNIAHLDSLEILCDLYVEYADLQKFIRTHGRTYESLGRNGRQIRFYPEVAQLNKVQAQIKEYSKMLGLLLKKDQGTESGGEAKAWE
jgi:phage terminase small subunit